MRPKKLSLQIGCWIVFSILIFIMSYIPLSGNQGGTTPKKPKTHPCETKNGGCSHICGRVGNKAICSCKVRLHWLRSVMFWAVHCRLRVDATALVLVRFGPQNPTQLPVRVIARNWNLNPVYPGFQYLSAICHFLAQRIAVSTIEYLVWFGVEYQTSGSVWFGTTMSIEIKLD